MFYIEMLWEYEALERSMATIVIFLGKDNSELKMVLQTIYLHLHKW